MKSFARDPFAIDPLPKAYYHPSPEKKLSRNKKSTAISPSRQFEDKNQRDQYDNSRVSPMDEIFLQGTNSFQPRQFHQESPDDVDFDETWPSSERPSSLSLTGLEEESPVDLGRFQATIDRFANIKQTLKFADQDETSKIPQRSQTGPAKHGHAEVKKGNQVKSRLPQKTEKLTHEKKLGRGSAKVEKPAESDGKMSGSVLQRYIERFRNSAPMSREERNQQKQSSSKDFWWLSPGAVPGQPDSPAPNQENNEDQTYDSIPLTAENLNQYSQWEQRLKKPSGRHRYPESPNDKKTIELQERAEKLLEKSSSTVLSTDPAVSTEGLGSNMSEMSSLEEYPYRPAFTTVIDRDRVSGRRGAGTRVPDLRPTVSHPEDDPLHQWRLRRKMDEAKTRPAKHTHKFDFLAKSDKEKMVDNQLEEFKRKLSGKPETSQRVQMRSSHGEFTPAPNLPQVSESNQFSRNQGQQRPQIASPILHRNRAMTDPEREVDPHLHLVCDLLPCPHHQQGSHSQLSQIDQQRDSYHTENRDKFKQFLEAEKPDVDKTAIHPHRQNEEENPDRESGKRINNISDDEYDTKKKSHRNGDRSDIEVSDNEIDRRKSHRNKDRSDMEGSDNEFDKRKSHRNRDRSDIEVSDSGEMNKISDRNKAKVKHKSKAGDTYDNGYRHKTVRIQDDRNTEDYTERRSRNIDESREDSDGDSRDSRARRRDKLPKPRESSSPKPEKRGLDQAIGQVVKNHLFSMSTSTVLSSVESLPPVSSVEGLPPSSRPPLSTLPEHSETHADESDQSDGGFAEDDLLQMLRRQRSLYEQQLQEIDNLLENLETS